MRVTECVPLLLRLVVWTLHICAICGSVAASGDLSATEGNVGVELMGKMKTDSYIVVLENGRTDSDGISENAEDLGVDPEAIFWIPGNGKQTSGFSAFKAELTSSQRDQVEASDLVDYIAEDVTFHISQVPPNLDRIDQRDLPLNDRYDPPNVDLRDITVFVIDSGARETHDLYEGRVVNEACFFSCFDEEDENGHGTHVAGTITAEEFGVTESVRVLALKVFGANGSGPASGILSAISFAVQTGTPNQSVLNLSLGSDSVFQPLNDAIDAAFDSGFISAVAAGNEDRDACFSSPASAEKAITVAAIDFQDFRAGFSNFGECVKIFAPGVNVESTCFESDSAVCDMSGTSMATPHVAAALAFILGEMGDDADVQDAADELLENATEDVLFNVLDSPNRLLFVGISSAADKTGVFFSLWLTLCAILLAGVHS